MNVFARTKRSTALSIAGLALLAGPFSASVAHAESSATIAVGDGTLQGTAVSLPFTVNCEAGNKFMIRLMLLQNGSDGDLNFHNGVIPTGVATEMVTGECVGTDQVMEAVLYPTAHPKISNSSFIQGKARVCALLAWGDEMTDIAAASLCHRSEVILFSKIPLQAALRIPACRGDLPCRLNTGPKVNKVNKVNKVKGAGWR